MFRSLILWMLGIPRPAGFSENVPIPIIILLWLFLR